MTDLRNDREAHASLVEQTDALEERVYGRALHARDQLDSEWDALRDWAAKPTLFDRILKLIRWDQS